MIAGWGARFKWCVEARSISIKTAENWYAPKTLPPRAGHNRRCREAMSSTVKTVKDPAAIKKLPHWTVDAFKA